MTDEIDTILNAMGPLVHAGSSRASFRDGFVRVDLDFGIDECVLGLWGMAETERDKEEIAATIHVGERLYARVIDAARRGDPLRTAINTDALADALTQRVRVPVVGVAPDPRAVIEPLPTADPTASIPEREVAARIGRHKRTLRRWLEDPSLPVDARPIASPYGERLRRTWTPEGVQALLVWLASGPSEPPVSLSITSSPPPRSKGRPAKKKKAKTHKDSGRQDIAARIKAGG